MAARPAATAVRTSGRIVRRTVSFRGSIEVLSSSRKGYASGTA
jgi:hypothetical protein